MLFFIELSTRRVHLAGLSEPPDGPWTAQQARNFVFSLSEHDRPREFLVRENDGKFTGAFDTVFNTEGIHVIHTPVRAPKANAVAERFVGTVRRECLDWILIANRRHLRHVLREFVDHYNRHRPHRRGLGVRAPRTRSANTTPRDIESHRDPQTRQARWPHPRVCNRRLKHMPDRIKAPHRLRCRRQSPEPTIASTVRAGFPPATASATKRSPRSGRTCAAPDERNRPNASARAPIGQVPARDDPRSS